MITITLNGQWTGAKDRARSPGARLIENQPLSRLFKIWKARLIGAGCYPGAALPPRHSRRSPPPAARVAPSMRLPAAMTVTECRQEPYGHQDPPPPPDDSDVLLGRVLAGELSMSADRNCQRALFVFSLRHCCSSNKCRFFKFLWMDSDRCQ